jgi:hypothetical protein
MPPPPQTCRYFSAPPTHRTITAPRSWLAHSAYYTIVSDLCRLGRATATRERAVETDGTCPTGAPEEPGEVPGTCRCASAGSTWHRRGRPTGSPWWCPAVHADGATLAGSDVRGGRWRWCRRHTRTSTLPRSIVAEAGLAHPERSRARDAATAERHARLARRAGLVSRSDTGLTRSTPAPDAGYAGEHLASARRGTETDAIVLSGSRVQLEKLQSNAQAR